MSDRNDRNVAVLRDLFDAYNARDIERFIACCDPSVELETAFAAVGGEVYHGHEDCARGIATSRTFGEVRYALS